MASIIAKIHHAKKLNTFLVLFEKNLTFSKVLTKSLTTPSSSSSKDNRPKVKTPIGKLDQVETEQINDPYAPFPDGKNPTTGELNGPRGPEPTRYGDWERKGRVSDF